MLREASPFEMALGTERRFAMRLRGLADKIGQLVNSFPNPIDNPTIAEQIDAALRRYSEALTPWAAATAGRMVASVDFLNRRAYAAHMGRIGYAENSRIMARALRQEILTAPTGQAMRELLRGQVGLIKSMPIEAGQRVHALAMRGIVQGHRASALSKMIEATGEVTRSRANLIARTETARTSSVLTQARATHVGSTEYVWRTAEDEDVRASHDRMDGRVVQWTSPPTLDGLTGHAGCVPNCRCYPEPVVPDL